jgi:hypothetical protein
MVSTTERVERTERERLAGIDKAERMWRRGGGINAAKRFIREHLSYRHDEQWVFDVLAEGARRAGIVPPTV